MAEIFQDFRLCLTFNASLNDTLVEDITEWLDDRGAPFKIEWMGAYGLDDTVLVYLPIGYENDATLLAIFRWECTAVCTLVK